MSISFKQFIQLTDLSDSEFQAVEEGLSDIPGLGWLKTFRGEPNKVQLDKIKAARTQLQNRRDKLSTERSAAIDAALQKFASGEKIKKPGEIDDVDWDRALPCADRKFHAKMDRMKNMPA